MNLLVIEDDAALGKALVKGLSEAGHGCEWVHDGKSGVEAACSHPRDAIILDLMLPDLAGLEVLQQIRGRGVDTPVVILTARGSVENRVDGLNCGADDYLVKPFAFAELTARLAAVCRRTAGKPITSLQVGPLTMELTSQRVTRNGTVVDLTLTEYRLLEYLVRHARQVVTRRMLCEHLWEADWEGVTNVIEVHINRLRSKIDRGFDRPLIHTVRGQGYVVRDD
ncbi:MAG: response regulator transcription factor [Pirellulaceae bacterium]